MKLREKIKIVLYCKQELNIEIKKWIDLIAFRKKWRQYNPDNGTTANNKFDISKVTVGEGTYGPITVIGFDNPDEKLVIGKYCSIAGNVTFLLGGEHPLDRITTFPYAHHILRVNNVDHTPTKGPIVIEDDVWLCHGVTILSGVRIGKGAVIAAGVVVSKDIPPYTIVVRNGEIRRKRFEDDVIEKLLRIDLNEIKNFDMYYQEYLLNAPITRENIDMIVEWFSTK